MPFGLPWSEALIDQIEDDEVREAFVSDQVRVRIAQLIRALREQEDRDWTQAELGRLMHKPQSVVSRIEDPEYGKLSLQTLFEVAAAFKLPLWIDIPEWEDWFRYTEGSLATTRLRRRSFDAERLKATARGAEQAIAEGAVTVLHPDSYSSINSAIAQPEAAPLTPLGSFDPRQPFVPQESTLPSPLPKESYIGAFAA
jgi:transcriptional regulator with XRE-family HTH domain